MAYKVKGDIYGSLGQPIYKDGVILSDADVEEDDRLSPDMDCLIKLKSKKSEETPSPEEESKKEKSK